jgi:hypothetical protein
MHQHLVARLYFGVFIADDFKGPSLSRALGERTTLLIDGPEREVRFCDIRTFDKNLPLL